MPWEYSGASRSSFWGGFGLPNPSKIDEKATSKNDSFPGTLFLMIFGYLCYHLRFKIGGCRKPFSKTRRFVSPSKTIVFPMYFEGWVLKYQVTIYEKMDQI